MQSPKEIGYKEDNSKYRRLSRMPWSHVRILIYRTWPKPIPKLQTQRGEKIAFLYLLDAANDGSVLRNTTDFTGGIFKQNSRAFDLVNYL